MKKKLIIPFILDVVVFVVLFINYRFYALIYLLLNIIGLIIIVKEYLKVDIININKLTNIIKTKSVREKLSNDEKYLEQIEIKTFDGSNGTTHPCIVKFDRLLNNYKYYMVHTPYDNHNVEFENPSLCVSNDKINFLKLDGVKDPLLPIIKQSGKVLKYYNDNFILYENNELQVWYRYTEEDKSVKPAKLKNQIYRIISKDGINFSKPELMIDDDSIWYLSPSLVKIDKKYYLYFFDNDSKMYCKTSNDLHNWNDKIAIKTNEFNGNCWHGEVKLVNDKLYLLLLSKDYKLYWCETNINNPFEFTINTKLKLSYYDKSNIYGNVRAYKSTFLIEDDYIILYIPFMITKLKYFKLKGIKHIKWVMTYTKIKLDNLSYIKDDING